MRALAAEVRMAKSQEERELARLKQLVAKERVYWKQQVRNGAGRPASARNKNGVRGAAQEDEEEEAAGDGGARARPRRKVCQTRRHRRPRHIISTNKLV